jgi:tetratricopeptide (TPR) repeat protein
MEEDTNLIGKQIATYRLSEEIASGHFGTVYQAQHILTDRVVALKMLHVHPPVLERFMQDAQFVTRLQHRHILSVSEMGWHDGRPYFVSEYMAGGSLRQRLNETPVLPWDQALSILQQIGEALRYAHQQKIVHCDLKPENILFNAQGELVVTDFCIATVLSTMSVEQLADLRDNSPYTAPEQFLGKVSKKNDQYALACMAYEMLTGQLPFSASDLSASHKELKPIPPRHFNEEIPPHSEDAILKALATKRSFRYDDLSAFVKGLQTPSRRDRMTDALVEQATTLLFYRQYEEAVLIYEQAIRLDPRLAVAYARMADALVKLERFEEAVLAYEQAMHHNYRLGDIYTSRADALMKLERFEEAVVAFDRAAVINPHDPPIYNNKGYALCHLARFEEALAAFEQTLLLDPTHVVACISKGNVLIRLGRYKEAVEAFDHALRLYPHFAETHNNKGHALDRLKRYEEAMQSYNRAIELDPDNPITYNNKGYTLHSLKRYEEAVQAFDEALSLDPSNRDAFHGKMLTLLGQQTEALIQELGISDRAPDLESFKENALSSEWDKMLAVEEQILDVDSNNADLPDLQRDAQGNINWLEEALKDFEESLRLDPGNPCALNGKGEVLVRLKRFAEALPALEEAVSINPNYAMAHNNKGDALFGLECYEEALKAYDCALSAEPKKIFAADNKKTDPNDPNWFTEMLVRDLNTRQQAVEINRASVYESKGDTLYQLKLYEDAIEAYEQASCIDPRSISAYNSKGNTLSKLERFEEAIEAYEQALRIEPTSLALYTNKAYALNQLDRYEETLRVYEQMLHLDPNNPVTYNNKGFALYCLKRHEEALEAYQQSLELDPNNAIVHTNKGRALLALKRYTKALAAFAQSSRLDPDYAGAYDGKAMALYHLNRIEEAAETVELAHHDDADFYNRKGMALLELSQYDEALYAFEQALRIDPHHADASGNKSFILALRRVYKIGKEFGLA